MGRAIVVFAVLAGLGSLGAHASGDGHRPPLVFRAAERRRMDFGAIAQRMREHPELLLDSSLPGVVRASSSEPLETVSLGRALRVAAEERSTAKQGRSASSPEPASDAPASASSPVSSSATAAGSDAAAKAEGTSFPAASGASAEDPSSDGDDPPLRPSYVDLSTENPEGVPQLSRRGLKDTVGLAPADAVAAEAPASGPALEEAFTSLPSDDAAAPGPAPEADDPRDFWEGTAYESVMSGCELRWRTQRVDQFSRQTSETYEQRWYFCGQHHVEGGPVLALLGSEDNIESFMQTTALVWEMAPLLGAATVWLEHRYYGLSQPYGADYLNHLAYLSQAQALADFATILFDVRQELGDRKTPIIGFGSSYGGELVVKMRMKYPHLLTGGIASAAPIGAYYAMDPAYDGGSFAAKVTQCATPYGLADSGCVPSVRAGFIEVDRLGASAKGQRQLNSALYLCPWATIKSTEDADVVNSYIANAWMSWGTGSGPANGYPIAQACYLQGGAYVTSVDEALQNTTELLYGVASAVAGLMQSERCIDVAGYTTSDQMTIYGPASITELYGYDNETSLYSGSTRTNLVYNYQTCTEMFAPFWTDGVHDMFPAEPWVFDEQVGYCRDAYGIEPRITSQAVQYGGRNIDSLTNVLFVNGLLDAWLGGEITESSTHTVINIPLAGHGDDLFPASQLDPPALTRARQHEYETVQGWIDEVRMKEMAKLTPSSPSTVSSSPVY